MSKYKDFEQIKIRTILRRLRLKVVQSILQRCERHPLKLCGAGCIFQEGLEECRDDVVGSLIQVSSSSWLSAGSRLEPNNGLQVPEEVCDLIPHKSCQLATKLLPRLTPVQKVIITHSWKWWMETNRATQAAFWNFSLPQCTMNLFSQCTLHFPPQCTIVPRQTCSVSHAPQRVRTQQVSL